MSKTDEYQRTADQYRQDAKEHGTESATERWCKPLFDAWMYSLDSETDRTSDETKRRLTALMRGNLNVRDAMIASIIDSTISTADMIGFAAYPKDKENKARMNPLPRNATPEMIERWAAREYADMRHIMREAERSIK